MGDPNMSSLFLFYRRRPRLMLQHENVHEVNKKDLNKEQSINILNCFLLPAQFTIDILCLAAHAPEICKTILHLMQNSVIVRIIFSKNHAEKVKCAARMLQQGGATIRWMPKEMKVKHNIVLVDAAPDSRKTTQSQEIQQRALVSPHKPGEMKIVKDISQSVIYHREMARPYYDEFMHTWNRLN